MSYTYTWTQTTLVEASCKRNCGESPEKMGTQKWENSVSSSTVHLAFIWSLFKYNLSFLCRVEKMEIWNVKWAKNLFFACTAPVKIKQRMKFLSKKACVNDMYIAQALVVSNNHIFSLLTLLGYSSVLTISGEDTDWIYFPHHKIRVI